MLADDIMNHYIISMNNESGETVFSVTTKAQDPLVAMDVGIRMMRDAGADASQTHLIKVHRVNPVNAYVFPDWYE